VTSSFRGDAKHRTRNLEIPGLVLTHHPGMTKIGLLGRGARHRARIRCGETETRGRPNERLETLELALDGTEITPGTPEDYADFIDKDEKKWSLLVKESGVEQE
jgi:hypothetical protein